MSIRSAGVVTSMLLLSGMALSAEQAGGQSAALGSTWADATKMPDLFSGMWMTFSGFVDGDKKLNVPYTAKAQKASSACAAMQQTFLCDVRRHGSQSAGRFDAGGQGRACQPTHGRWIRLSNEHCR